MMNELEKIRFFAECIEKQTWTEFSGNELHAHQVALGYCRNSAREILKLLSKTEDEFKERGLPSRVDTEASGLTLAPEEAKAETSKDVAWSLPCEGITGDLDPAHTTKIEDQSNG